MHAGDAVASPAAGNPRHEMDISGPIYIAPQDGGRHQREGRTECLRVRLGGNEWREWIGSTRDNMVHKSRLLLYRIAWYPGRKVYV